MGSEIQQVKTYTIGDTVYRRWMYPDRGHLPEDQRYWYEGCHVEKITPKLVFCVSPDRWTRFTLKRRALEKWGYTVSRTTGGVYFAEMPEEYRKQTIGYLLRTEERELFGLDINFKPEDLKNAYRTAVKKHHPDAGGDPETFRKIKEAHDRLVNGPSLGEMFAAIFRETDDDPPSQRCDEGGGPSDDGSPG